MSDIWTIFAFGEGGSSEPTDLPPPVYSFRIHIGDLTDAVKRQVVASMRRECTRRGATPERIAAYSFPNIETVNGHQRWVGNHMHETLWERTKVSG